MTRKYRQRGYRDDEVEADRRSGRRPETASGEGPRGRGLGAPKASVFKCARCGSKATRPVAFDSVCPTCGGDLHTCTNCRHFDSGAPNECREAVQEWIRSKATRNACGLFAVRIVQERESGRGSTADDARSAFDALFD